MIDYLSCLMRFLVLGCSVFVGGVSLAETQPNIVFLFVDDQTTSTLGCYGNSIVQTPNIDDLARRGVRFENAFVSHSICWISRTTVLTGLTGRSFGTHGNQDLARPETLQTLCPDVLRQSGYRTGFYGKWHATTPDSFLREDHFDEMEVIDRNPYYKKQPDGSLRHETELIVDRGIDFIKSQPAGKPFALNLWFNACHAEDGDRRPGIGHFAWPRTVDGMYDDVVIAPPKLNDPKIFDALPEFLQTSINRERYFWRWNTDQKYQTNIRAYYRMVSGIDHEIGRLLKTLDDAGIADNTIIVYSADNGYYMGNRGLAGKWTHYEESLRVPLIICDPRVPEEQQGKVTDAIALNLDLPATFIDWAGVNVPNQYQGASLKPIVDAKKPGDWRIESFHEHFAVRKRIPAFEGIRNEEFKYVCYFDHNNYEFLHDLKHDPNELVNLATDPKYESTLKQMRQRTALQVERLGGPLASADSPFEASTVPYPEASAAVSASVDDEGYVKLLDGKSLNGWSGDPKYWSAKDQTLTGVTDGSLKENQFITWKGSTIRNFDLRVKVNISAGGNSGLQYRGTSRPDLGLDIVTGYQCDIVANNPDYNGMLYEERGRRILSHTGERVIVGSDGQTWVIEKLPVEKFEADQWHDYRVLVEGNHHQHWIDGVMTADLVDLDESGRALEGVLAVQVHVGPAMTVKFKDFKIKHLPDTLPLVTAQEFPIPANAYGVKPQGKLPPDWKPPVFETLTK